MTRQYKDITLYNNQWHGSTGQRKNESLCCEEGSCCCSILTINIDIVKKKVSLHHNLDEDDEGVDDNQDGYDDADDVGECDDKRWIPKCHFPTRWLEYPTSSKYWGSNLIFF